VAPGLFGIGAASPRPGPNHAAMPAQAGATSQQAEASHWVISPQTEATTGLVMAPTVNAGAMEH